MGWDWTRYQMGRQVGREVLCWNRFAARGDMACISQCWTYVNYLNSGLLNVYVTHIISACYPFILNCFVRFNIFFEILLYVILEFLVQQTQMIYVRGIYIRKEHDTNNVLHCLPLGNMNKTKCRILSWSERQDSLSFILPRILYKLFPSL